jgi:hypothetical protein
MTGHCESQIRKPAILTDRLFLKIRYEVSERIVAGIVVVLILPRETAEREYHIRIQQARPCWRDIESSDLRTLIGGTDRQAVGAEPPLLTTSPDQAVAF